ncbi:serine protease inhibitor Kazal-type 14 isoform X1 [Equus przewalskii]|uniref:Serine protease inhibitor Kazal-type 14 isoform X1 n=1 Tax=Equus przewalskii TaxID=9798 RepID=A0ABM4KB08_EQUPR
MAKSFPVLSSLSFFIMIRLVLTSAAGPRQWWPPHGPVKHDLIHGARSTPRIQTGEPRDSEVELTTLTTTSPGRSPIIFFNVKCPFRKVDLSWFSGTVNPCPGLYQPICGTNLITYENPCILCVESMKSRGKIRFKHDGKC